jgi:hypothetical protein
MGGFMFSVSFLFPVQDDGTASHICPLRLLEASDFVNLEPNSHLESLIAQVLGVAIARILFLSLPILLWIVSWSAASQGFILAGLLVGTLPFFVAPFLGFAYPWQPASLSVCSCTCFRTYCRIHDRLMSHILNT